MHPSRRTGVQGRSSSAAGVTALFVPALALLAGCGLSGEVSKPELRAAMLDSGLPPEIAFCMADRLHPAVSTADLRRLASPRAFRQGDQIVSAIDEYIARTGISEQRALAAEVMRAHSHCAGIA